MADELTKEQKQAAIELATRHVAVEGSLPPEESLMIARALLSLKGELEAARGVCAEAYQLAGAIGAPVAVLDNLSDASHGAPLRHETFLPIAPDDCAEFAGLRAELTEARAQLEMVRNELSTTLEFWGSNIFDVEGSVRRALAQITAQPTGGKRS